MEHKAIRVASGKRQVTAHASGPTPSVHNPHYSITTVTAMIAPVVSQVRCLDGLDDVDRLGRDTANCWVIANVAPVSASAVIVSDGLTPGFAGIAAPSH